ncbi:autoinducer synthase [Meridianimarinicoccus roseus]|jgi:acyl homoserine lactone synthase|uniref:Acyl-homoserine-lactone synthase n=1 Tax=Meridianimarinicoccus roseus TaxID=2072018 RepID=A0A2V2LCW0_9RHOB|nr:acyl-homoserine-lactone synthase [Meridianimarinicoccus roseus]PWR01354.1 autoinducer synthase [Meridianimarinicoccus roseus]
MLRYIYGSQLDHHPKLRDTMFRDRADQFHTRLGWDVSVSENGEERDQYDGPRTLYVIWETEAGQHGGSMRFLPTTGPTMINDHFLPLLEGYPMQNDKIMECTRFCLARNAAPRVSAALMLGGAELGLGFRLSFSVGVFDARMVRIYSRLGWAPMILGSSGEGREAVSAGLWAFSEPRAHALCEKASIPRGLSRLWFHRAMAERPQRLAQIA